MRTFLTWAVAGAAIASSAVLTLAGVAGAATMPKAATKAPTTLSITESKAHSAPGQRDVISCVLVTGKNPLGERLVELYRYDAVSMTWVRVAVGHTDQIGKATFAVRPMSTAEYRLRFPGSKTLAASRSGTARIVVAKLATTLSVGESKTSVAGGLRDVLTGTLLTGKNPLNRRVVALYSRNAMSGMWMPVATDRTGKQGRVAFVVKPMTTTTYELVFYGSPTLAAARSGAAIVTVTP
jgi:hypothetical protein